MLGAFKQVVRVQPDGRIEICAPGLPPGSSAEVIVIAQQVVAMANQLFRRVEIRDSSSGEVVGVYYSSCPTEPARGRLAAWEALKNSLQLSADSALQWIADARSERISMGSRR